MEKPLKIKKKQLKIILKEYSALLLQSNIIQHL